MLTVTIVRRKSQFKCTSAHNVIHGRGGTGGEWGESSGGSGEGEDGERKAERTIRDRPRAICIYFQEIHLPVFKTQNTFSLVWAVILQAASGSIHSSFHPSFHAFIHSVIPATQYLFGPWIKSPICNQNLRIMYIHITLSYNILLWIFLNQWSNFVNFAKILIWTGLSSSVKSCRRFDTKEQSARSIGLVCDGCPFKRSFVRNWLTRQPFL